MWRRQFPTSALAVACLRISIRPSFPTTRAEWTPSNSEAGTASKRNLAGKPRRGIDIEGALRYHLSGTSDTLRTDREIVSGLDIIGAEGGIRLHPRRGWSNSGPYLRGGIGSFSTTLSLDKGAASQNGEPALGFYAGIGYVHEISGSWGVDLRATYIRFNAFDMNADGRKFRAGFLAVTASLVVF